MPSEARAGRQGVAHGRPLLKACQKSPSFNVQLCWRVRRPDGQGPWGGSHPGNAEGCCGGSCCQRRSLGKGPPPLWTTLKPGPEDSGTAKQLGRDTRCSPKSSCSHGNTTATPRQREPQGSSKSKPQDRSSHTEPCKELKVAQTC